mgnify:CR=1 FL=1
MKTVKEKLEMSIEVVELFEKRQFERDEMIGVLVNVLSCIAAAYVDDLRLFWSRINAEGLRLSTESKVNDGKPIKYV